MRCHAGGALATVLLVAGGEMWTSVAAGVPAATTVLESTSGQSAEASNEPDHGSYSEDQAEDGTTQGDLILTGRTSRTAGRTAARGSTQKRKQLGLRLTLGLLSGALALAGLKWLRPKADGMSSADADASGQERREEAISQARAGAAVAAAAAVAIVLFSILTRTPQEADPQTLTPVDDGARVKGPALSGRPLVGGLETDALLAAGNPFLAALLLFGVVATAAITVAGSRALAARTSPEAPPEQGPGAPDSDAAPEAPVAEQLGSEDVGQEKEREASAPEVGREEPTAEVRQEEPTAEVRQEEPTAEVKQEEPTAEVKQEEPTAEVGQEEPTPEVRQEEPTPEVRQEEPTPEVRQEEPTAEVGQEEPTAEVRQEEPTAEVRQEEPTPEVRQEEPTPEVRQEEPTPEVRQEEPAAEGKQEDPPEGRQEEPTAEGRQEEPTAEGRQEEPTAEGKQEEPTAEGRQEEPTAEVRQEEPTPEVRQEEPTAEVGHEEPTAEVGQEELAPGAPAPPDPAEEDLVSRLEPEAPVLTPAGFEERIHALYPEGVEDLVSSVRSILETRTDDGHEPASMEAYLQATLETNDPVEKAFRVSRLVMILEASKLRDVYAEVLSSRRILKEGLEAGREVSSPRRLISLWNTELSEIEETMAEARKLALTAYSLINPEESHNVKMYMKAESFSLELRQDAVNDMVLETSEVHSGNTPPLANRQSVLLDIRGADADTMDYATQVVDDLVLVKMPLSLSPVVLPLPSE